MKPIVNRSAAFTGYNDWTREGEELLYAITDRRLYAGNKADGLARLLELATAWAANGVSFIQLREKDLSAREQVELARAVVRAVGQVSGKTIASRVLVNGRVDVALSAEADGVHRSQLCPCTPASAGCWDEMSRLCL